MATDVKHLSGMQLVTWRLIVASIVIIPIAGTILAAAFLQRAFFSPYVLLLAALTYLLTGLGITIGYHRLFTHRSFEAPRWLRLLLALLGSAAMQGPIVRWVADHRRHHRFADRPGDPHSPRANAGGVLALLQGMVYAHLGWFFDAEKSRASCYAPDLLADGDIRLIDSLYPFWVLMSIFGPGVVTFGFTRSFHQAAWSVGVAGFLRIFLVQHVTWSVNSVGHTFGGRRFETGDRSTNSVFLGVLALGEGWHNNHHAFPYSARHGLKAEEFDLSWQCIRGLEVLGFAQNVRLPVQSRVSTACGCVEEKGHYDSSSTEEPSGVQRLTMVVREP